MLRPLFMWHWSSCNMQNGALKRKWKAKAQASLHIYKVSQSPCSFQTTVSSLKGSTYKQTLFWIQPGTGHARLHSGYTLNSLFCMTHLFLYLIKTELILCIKDSQVFATRAHFKAQAQSISGFIAPSCLMSSFRAYHLGCLMPGLFQVLHTQCCPPSTTPPESYFFFFKHPEDPLCLA